MSAYGSMFFRGLALAMGVAACALLGGCGPSQRRPEAVGPIFFPSAPEKPRLQFLKSFSGPADLGVAGPSGFERFVLGTAEPKEGITTPYGLAIFDGKLYVCDVGRRRVEVLDLEKRSFTTMTDDRRLVNPVNIAIEDDGTKYVADPTAGAVFVFDARNALRAILGKDLRINPIDVAVRDSSCYVTDFTSNRVVVLDKTTGREIQRMGEQGDGDTQFKLIGDLAIGPDGDIYVTDKVKAKIFQFDPSGKLKRTIARLGDNIDELVRPKGIAVDDEHRVWVVDAGVAIEKTTWSTEVAKIYDAQGRLLLFFGQPGNEPGRMNLPAQIVLDRRHVDLFTPYAVPGAKIEFLVLVSNQYGPHKINVYGFGEFPAPETAPETAAEAPRPAPAEEPAPPEAAAPEVSAEPPAPPEATAPKVSAETPTAPPTPAPKPAGEPIPTPQAKAESPAAPAAPVAEQPSDDLEITLRIKAAADLYLQSMKSYRAGDLTLARMGFVEVLRSGLIPPPMVEMINGYIQDIDRRLAGQPGEKP
jgi:sugar lactone lactonase YvrE